MTTIAFRRDERILAADTLAVTSSHGRAGFIKKIIEARRPTTNLSQAAPKVLLAVSGFAPTSFRLRDWWMRGQKTEQPDSEHSGSLIVFSRNDIGPLPEAIDIEIFCSGGHQPEVKAPFYAYGSGQQYAIAAMDMGATAEEAVAIAIKYDIYSGGEITCLPLPD